MIVLVALGIAPVHVESPCSKMSAAAADTHLVTGRKQKVWINDFRHLRMTEFQCSLDEIEEKAPLTDIKRQIALVPSFDVCLRLRFGVISPPREPDTKSIVWDQW